MAKGEGMKEARFLSGIIYSLRRANTAHLGSNVGSRRDVEVNKRCRETVIRQSLVVEKEPDPCLGVPEPLEVHGKKGNVRDDIAIAQLVTELDAVENSYPVIEAEHVLGLKIPVSVTHMPRRNPLIE